MFTSNVTFDLYPGYSPASPLPKSNVQPLVSGGQGMLVTMMELGRFGYQAQGLYFTNCLFVNPPAAGQDPYASQLISGPGRKSEKRRPGAGAMLSSASLESMRDVRCPACFRGVPRKHGTQRLLPEGLCGDTFLTRRMRHGSRHVENVRHKSGCHAFERFARKHAGRSMLDMLSGSTPKAWHPAGRAHLGNWHKRREGLYMPAINRSDVRSNESSGRRPQIMRPGLVRLLALVSGLSTALHAHADPQRAVVRLPSHGGSGTVIATTEHHTFILSCAHAFQGGDALKPIQIDGEQVPAGPPRLVAVDYEHDLSLIEIPAGNAPNVAPVAGPGHKPSARLLSVGYDEMRLPATERPAHIVKCDSDITWTREPPWHGRSGGALLDLHEGVLIGVVSGYVNYPEGPGLYVSHRDIGLFLEEQHWSSAAGSMRTVPKPMFSFPDPRPPQVRPFFAQPEPLFSQPEPFFSCPPGG